MTFSELLNKYIEQLSCTGKELSEVCGLSPSVISRYRKGERVPAAGSEPVAKLAHGISILSGDTEGVSVKEIRSALNDTLRQESEPDTQGLTDNLNALIDTLGIAPGELARALNYDSSYISKIRAGQRRPADVTAFAQGVAQYTLKHYQRQADWELLQELMGCGSQSPCDPAARVQSLSDWLCSTSAPHSDAVEHFLEKLDNFDLNAYIRSIRFDELKVPSLPLAIPLSRNYYGLAEMRQGELDFFKTTVLSHSAHPVFMCSDMPMTDLAEDREFPKKWMFGLAVMLKKGLHINMVHYLDRPLHELMLGLESWIPLYMTGQVSPYYMKSSQNAVYNHLNYVSGAAALVGDCVAGFHSDGKYYLTNKKTELEFYIKKADRLLTKALPLMDIFRAEKRSGYEAFLRSEDEKQGSLRSILSSPPIYTLPEDLLIKILHRNSLSSENQNAVLEYAAAARQRMEQFLTRGIVCDELYRLSTVDFEKYPPALSLTGMFYEKNICYTYEEYKEHIGATEQFAQNHANYSVTMNLEKAFRNIQITMREGEWVMLSKNQSPTIHFVIRHPKLRNSIENMEMPVVE